MKLVNNVESFLIFSRTCKKKNENKRSKKEVVSHKFAFEERPLKR